jgi:hypothetical protein
MDKYITTYTERVFLDGDYDITQEIVVEDINVLYERLPQELLRLTPQLKVKQGETIVVYSNLIYKTHRKDFTRPSDTEFGRMIAECIHLLHEETKEHLLARFELPITFSQDSPAKYVEFGRLLRKKDADSR